MKPPALPCTLPGARPRPAWRLHLDAVQAPRPMPPTACVLLPYDPASFVLQQVHDEGLPWPEELARSVPARQAEFFHGRLAARAALHSLGAPDTAVGRGPDRAPQWPQGFVGSLSHTRRWAVAWVGRRAEPAGEPVGDDVGLGVDLEGPLDAAAQATVRAQALDADEAERLLDGAPDADHALRLTVAFSAKEALFKAVHARCVQMPGFEASAVVGWRPAKAGEPGALVLELTQPLGPGLPARRRFEVRWYLLDDGTVLSFVAG